MSLLLLILAYLALLFALGLWGEGRGRLRSPWIYTLSLGVYATAWTFYGSVGRATQEGVGFLPIYLGPTLGLLLWPFWLKLLRLAKRHRLTSWPDFLSARYGNDRLLGSLAALLLTLGLLPYLALQLKAISQSFIYLQGSTGGPQPQPLEDVALYTALALALFTVLFGTRRLDPLERHPGLVLAVAFESLVKLLAFLVVAVFVIWKVFQLELSLPWETERLAPSLEDQFNWSMLILLSMLAFFFLPRQFYVMVVENEQEEHLRQAAWAFPLYLWLINLPVLPLSLAGLGLLPGLNPDLFVLALPLHLGSYELALLAFLGGFSAATAMVVVEALALSILISNTLLSPLVLRSPLQDPGQILLNLRRVTVVVLLILAYLYFRFSPEASLVQMGLVSFVAAAQLAPAGLLGLFWKEAGRLGVLLGLLAGYALWAYGLFLPGLWPEVFPGFAPWFSGLDPVAQTAFLSLGANLALAVLGSYTFAKSKEEERQAQVFVLEQAPPAYRADWERVRPVLGRFLEAGVLEELARSPEGLEKAEALLAGVLGPASARLLMASVAQEAPRVEEVVEAVEAYRSLKELDQLKDEFIATVSHELRTPLTAIRSFAELLHMRPGMPEEERREFLRLLMEESQRLSRLVNRVLDLAELQAGPGLKREPLDLASLAQEALKLSTPLLAERGLGVETCLEPAILEGDPDRLLQLLLNLLSNAARHAKSRVWVRTYSEGGQSRLEVEDDGPGVPPEMREAIFESFRKLGKGGTGLGLAICRRIAQAHGGRLWVEGEAGARFILEVERGTDTHRGG